LAIIGTTVASLVKGRLSGGTQEAPTYVDPTYEEPVNEVEPVEEVNDEMPPLPGGVE